MADFLVGDWAFGDFDVGGSGSTFKAFFSQIQELGEMLKNVAGQKIGSQLISVSDGSAFSGIVTVYVTGDAGTQSIGSVASGVCVDEGNGYYTYSPSQAETNFDLVAFTFVGSGAKTETIQVRTWPTAGLASVNNISQVGSVTGSVGSVASYGTLVADIASAVWGATTRTLSAISDSSGITTLLGRLSGARAGFLDNLNSAVGVTLNAIQGLYAPTKVSDIPTTNQIAAAVDVALINTGDGADLLQAIANQIAADWVAGDASPLAVVSALTSNATFIQLVADAASAKNTANTINTKLGTPSVSIAADIATRSTLTTADIDARLNAYDAPTNAEMVAAFTQIKGATFNASTDSLEAIRDRGDAAWITGSGGSGGGDATLANQVIIKDNLAALIAAVAEVPKVDEPLTYSDTDESYVVTISR